MLLAFAGLRFGLPHTHSAFYIDVGLVSSLWLLFRFGLVRILIGFVTLSFPLLSAHIDVMGLIISDLFFLYESELR